MVHVFIIHIEKLYLDCSWWIQHSTWPFWFVTDCHIVLFLSTCNRHVTCAKPFALKKEIFIWIFVKNVFPPCLRYNTYLIRFINNIFKIISSFLTWNFHIHFLLFLLELWGIFSQEIFVKKIGSLTVSTTIICNITPRLVLILIRIFVCLCVHLLLRVI